MGVLHVGRIKSKIVYFIH